MGNCPTIKYCYVNAPEQPDEDPKIGVGLKYIATPWSWPSCHNHISNVPHHVINENFTPPGLTWLFLLSSSSHICFKWRTQHTSQYPRTENFIRSVVVVWSPHISTEQLILTINGILHVSYNSSESNRPTWWPVWKTNRYTWGQYTIYLYTVLEQFQVKTSLCTDK